MYAILLKIYIENIVFMGGLSSGMTARCGQAALRSWRMMAPDDGSTAGAYRTPYWAHNSWKLVREVARERV